MALISGFGMILVGVGFVFYWIRAARVPLLPFLWGALLWVITVAIKFAVAIPFNRPLLKYFILALHPVTGGIAFSVYVGLLTGIFECGLCYLVIRLTFMREYDFNHAIAFGIGFGAIEAILLGLVALIKVLVPGHPAGVVPLVSISIPIVERFFTILVHVFSAVLIFYSIRYRKFSYFLLSFFTKTAMDGFAGWFSLNFKFTPANLWMAEGVVTVFGIFSFIGSIWIKKKYPADAGPKPEAAVA